MTDQANNAHEEKERHDVGRHGAERIGVYVCHCGSNISATVDVEDVAVWSKAALGEDGVVIARDYKFMCSSLGEELIERDIENENLTRVVVAACSPHLHEQTFRSACSRGGLNPYLCELVSIREQVSWVHTDKAEATAKAKAVIAGGIQRVIENEPLEPLHVPIHPDTLVVGGGLPAFKPPWKSPMPATKYIWWSENPLLAAIWPNLTKPSPPWTAPPVF